MKLSDHFDSTEFACHHCGMLPAEVMSEALIEGLERLRFEVGEPIHVTSGYRCPTHNAAVGGVPNSQHVQATAADIYCEGLSPEELGAYAVEIFDGVGIYDSFVHVDMRDYGDSTGAYRW